MEAWDYTRSGLFENGLLKGMAVSVPFHMTAVLLTLAAAWLMPPRKIEPPLCMVTLLSMQAPGQGTGINCAIRKGDGVPSPGGAPALPTPPEPEASVEPQKADAMQLAEMKRATTHFVSIPGKIEKPIKKPKSKPAPKAPQKQEVAAKAEVPAPPTTSAATQSDAPPPSNAPFSGYGEGPGRETSGSTADGNAEAGAVAGSGPGGGGKGENGPGKNLYEQGEVDLRPAPIQQVKPLYPHRAKRLQLDGKVGVRFLVTETGAVSNIKVLESTPPGMFDDSVVSALSTWKFSPGKVGGKAVSTWVVTSIEFKFEDI